MSQNFCITIALICLCSSASSQTHKLHGTVTNTLMEPLAFVTVQVKNYPTGVISKENGRYELALDEGRYEIAFTMVGYKPRVIVIVINKKDYLQNIILESDERQGLSEVTVSARVKDRSEEIIRNVIRNKDRIQEAAGDYSTMVYVKAFQEDSSRVINKKKKRKNVGSQLQDSASLRQKAYHDSTAAVMNTLAMAEVVLRLDVADRKYVKEERIGISKRGNIDHLFYLSTTEGNFNFYENLVRVPQVSTTPILSPFSYSGLLAYRFKVVKSEITSNGKVFTISVKPRQLSNATVEGEVKIADSTWVILHTRFSFPVYHLPVYNYFEVEQHYAHINSKAWLISTQTFNYFSRGGKGKKSGTTNVVYNDYELNKTFKQNEFGNEVSTTTSEAYERDTTFWNQRRTQPLTAKELRFIEFKDSVYRATNSKQYLDSLDSAINKVTLKKILLLGQSFNDHEKESSWSFPPLPAFYQPLQFGGSRISLGFGHQKTSKSRKNYSLFTDISYGLRNKDINGYLRFSRIYNPFNRGSYTIHAGRSFEFIFSGDAWINMLKRSNIYLNNSIGMGHGIELMNGLFLYSDLDLAIRRSVADYKTNSSVDSIFGGVLDNNQAVYFQPYNAVYSKFRLQYTPQQKYIREPKEKIILGSRWPTFYALWRKGIKGVMDSEVDFDYLEFGIEQEVKLGLLGNSRYNLRSGSFVSKSDLRLVDYQFQRRGDPILFNNPQEAFQSLDSTFPLFNRFYQGHHVHEFNGVFVNKLPLLKKLKLREVAGAGFLIAPERNLKYVELFGGVERVFNVPFNPGSKFKLGAYVIGSAANQFKNPVQFKIGITSWDKRRGKWF